MEQDNQANLSNSDLYS